MSYSLSKEDVAKLFDDYKDADKLFDVYMENKKQPYKITLTKWVPKSDYDLNRELPWYCYGMKAEKEVELISEDLIKIINSLRLDGEMNKKVKGWKKYYKETEDKIKKLLGDKK